MRYVVLTALLLLPLAAFAGDDAPDAQPVEESVAETVREAPDGDSPVASQRELDDAVVKAAVEEARQRLIPGEFDVTLDLDTAQRRALEDNPNLGASKARVDQAIARVKQARSRYLPVISASYQATHTHLAAQTVEYAKRGLDFGILQSATSSLSILQNANLVSVLSRSLPQVYTAIRARQLFDEAVNRYDASLQAGFTVFDGFSRKYTVAIAKYGQQELEEGYREAQRMLLQAVAQSYYGTQLARENMAIAQADIDFQARLLKDANARRRVGTGSLSDVLNFEVRIRAAQTALLSARQDYEASRVALASLMGLPEGELPENMGIAELYSETPVELSAPEADALIAYALENRPDVILSGHTVSRSKATVGQRRAVFYPQVDVFATRDATSTDNGRFDTDDFNSTVGVQVSYDIFTGGRNRAAVAEAKSLRTESEYLSNDAEIQAAADVRDAVIRLGTAQQQLILQRATAEYVEKNRDLVEKEYEVGQGALARLNQAQRDLIEAQARLASARVALRLAWHTLRTSTAETLEPFSS